jgi:hypothetical protein
VKKLDLISFNSTKIDNSTLITVMTAKSIQTLGRADTGTLKNSIIAEKGDMQKPLISFYSSF